MDESLNSMLEAPVWPKWTPFLLSYLTGLVRGLAGLASPGHPFYEHVNSNDNIGHRPLLHETPPNQDLH
jgi:hypothetical protein